MNTRTLAMLEFDYAQWVQPFTQRWWQETTCSILVGIACGALGCFVVLRRMALIGDALSHAVLPGVVLAFIAPSFLIGFFSSTQSALLGQVHWLPWDGTPPSEVSVTSLLVGALLAGLTTAVLINLVNQFSRVKEDSAVGIVFTALFALGVILISGLPRGTHFDLKCFLFGDPLAVLPSDLVMMSIVVPLVILIVVLLYHPLKLISFDPVAASAMGLRVSFYHYLLMGLLSATVVAGLKTTGVILVVAMVITPASAAYQLTNRLSVMLVLAGLMGAVSAAVGMSLAFVTNSPTGPAMVLVAATLFGMTMIFSPSHGILFDRLRRRKLGRHILIEDVLKAVYKLTEKGQQCELAVVAGEAKLTVQRLKAIVALPEARGMVNESDAVLSLTGLGLERAMEMVRSHRLWESYLSSQAVVGPEAIHAHAEVLEHVHELADEIDKTLGHPAKDPHGEAIPPRHGDDRK